MKKVICMMVCLGMICTSAYAGYVKCTVTGVDGAILPEGTNNVVILECANVEGFVIGQEIKVKIKTSKDKAQIEGC